MITELDIKATDSGNLIAEVLFKKDSNNEFTVLNTKGGLSRDTIIFLHAQEYVISSIYHRLDCKGDSITFVHLPMYCDYCDTEKMEVMYRTNSNLYMCNQCNDEYQKYLASEEE